MLKGISKYISPRLLYVLSEMGHGDEIVLADAHFPGHSVGIRTLRADGVSVALLLDAILPLFELDSYVTPLVMMSAEPSDQLDPAVEAEYMRIVSKYAPAVPSPARLPRQAFYERAGRAFAVVMTGEVRKYGNLLLKKGVTPA